MKLYIDRIEQSEIDAALRLSTGAGWNQVEEDWRRLMDLWPGTCLGGRVDGELVATATLAVYGEVGWVGMVLVDPGHQKRGYGIAMLDEIIRVAGEKGVKVLGLDATDQGRPVYLKRDFADEVGIDRWRAERAVGAVRPMNVLMDWGGILAMDFAATAYDRQMLLKHLAGEEGAVVRVEGSPMEGFGFARQGREAFYVGPIIAGSSRAAGNILRGILGELAAMDGDRPVLMDLPEGSLLEGVLPELGFGVSRKLTRMLRPARAATGHISAAVVAGSGFELG